MMTHNGQVNLSQVCSNLEGSRRSWPLQWFLVELDESEPRLDAAATDG